MEILNKKNSLKKGDIQKKLNLSKKSTNKLLRILKEIGLIEKNNKNRFKLTELGKESINK